MPLAPAKQTDLGSINHSGFVQEVVFSSTGGFDHCWRTTGEYDKGVKKRGAGERKGEVGWHEL